MARVVVLFEPPSTGKSTVIGEMKRDYPNAQIISIDKDTISNYFSPSLSRVRNEEDAAPADLVWKTTGHMIELILTEFRAMLTREVPAGEDGLVVFIQGVTSGGVENDIETFLQAGFEMDFVLSTTTSPEILHKRIVNRASQPGYIGAPPMPVEELQGYMNSCSAYFQQVVAGLKSRNKSTEGIPGSDDLKFYDNPDYRDKISYQVILTRPRENDLDLTPFDANAMETKLFMEDFDENEIEIADGTIKLTSSDGTEYQIYK